MDYLPGGNLRQLLQDLRANNQWLPLSEAVGVIRQVCVALDYLAHQGAPARGIKPSDLMLKPDQAEGLPYRPVLTSLGLLGESEGEWLPEAERVETSAYAYWSPEQLMGEPVDARSQVYSLGVLLYELCVGWQPFPVKTISEAVRAHTRSTPPAPRARRADLPASVEGVILRALEKDPAARYPDPAALAQALDDAQALAEVTDAAAQAAPGAWLVSLLVAYQRSLAAARTEALAARAEPEAMRAMVPGRVKVVGPAGAVRWEPLKAHGLTIGRDPNNDLILDEPTVAPQHARVEFDDPHYQVVDLDSQSGTYLGGLKLMPGMPAIWEPKAPLLIGDHWLYLELGATAMGTPARPSVYRFDGAVVDANLVQFSPNGWVGVYVEVPQLALTPGQKSSAGVVVVNQGPDNEHFSLTLGGVPQSWIAPPAPPTSLQLSPGEYRRLRITLEPPRAPQSRAGRDAVVVRVASQSQPDQAVEAKIAVTVPAFNQFRSELSAPGAGSKGPMRVTIHNQGNTPEAYRVALEDPEGSLAFDPPGFSLPVPAGHIGTADFYAGPRNTRLIGGRRTHRFTVRVADSTGQAQTHAAEAYSSGLAPPWAPILLLIMGCLLASAAGLVASDWRRRAFATSTAIARQTADAIAAADSDNDGLTNLDEVRLGTDPLNPDTDGDGANDNVDPDPGQLPTPNAHRQRHAHAAAAD
ncbi:MAG: FHA domain-containing protein [Anaerolineales bacterium]|nr:FHA domain-containing protein [Anaerolineales bacterium]